MASKQVALAKISRPRLHEMLARSRLHRVLDKAFERPVVWLCALPGAGKTTLVASYLEARKRPDIWYQLDAADADPASFIYHLRMAAVGETRANAGKRGVAGDAVVQALHERSNGWAAGLTLLLTRTRGQSGAQDDDDAESLQHVFDQVLAYADGSPINVVNPEGPRAK